MLHSLFAQITIPDVLQGLLASGSAVAAAIL